MSDAIHRQTVVLAIETQTSRSGSNTLDTLGDVVEGVTETLFRKWNYVGVQGITVTGPPGHRRRQVYTSASEGQPARPLEDL
jgi:hypothetical protein